LVSLEPEALALYVVTDPLLAGDRTLPGVCAQAMQAGAAVVQLRDKRASTRELLEQARALLELAAAHGSRILINDRVDVALAAGAHGVHLGQDDLPPADARRLLGPEAVIGVSVRCPEEARAAERDGADYLAANLVYPTDTKTDLPAPIGLDGLRALRAASALPLVAIGGIDAERAGAAVAAGADGVAVVSAVMAAPDPALACRELLAAVARGREGR
jgi:thiamine-phosphate pyrophosphorylase